MTSTTTTTKRGKQTEAATTLALPPQTEEGALRAALLAATTPAQFLAAANTAAGMAAAADASHWEQTLTATRAIGEGMYGAYRATLLQQDGNTIVKPASEVGFTAIASTLWSLTKSDYEALEPAKRPGPGRRSWSSLSEDYRAWVVTSGDTWLEAYEASVGDAKRGIRAYLTFVIAAEAEATRATEAGETSQMKSARTKRERAAAAAAEVERQTTAAAAAKRKRDEDAQAAADKARDAATAWVRQATEHPHANLVTGVDLTGATALALNAAKLTELAQACDALAAHVTEQAAAAAVAHAAAIVDAAHGTESEVAALGAQAEAVEAPASLSPAAAAALAAMPASALDALVTALTAAKA